MEKTIKETTRLLAQGIIKREEADKILLGLFGVVQAKPERYCKGSVAFGTGCKKCKRCLDYMSKFKIL